MLVFGLSATYRAFITPLQFDEFFTLFISRLSSLSEMVQAMPADGQPPLQYLLTHVFIRMFGETEIAVRALGTHLLSCRRSPDLPDRTPPRHCRPVALCASAPDGIVDQPRTGDHRAAL